MASCISVGVTSVINCQIHLSSKGDTNTTCPNYQKYPILTPYGKIEHVTQHVQYRNFIHIKRCASNKYIHDRIHSKLVKTNFPNMLVNYLTIEALYV
jgi:hypothetical protein